MTSANNLSRRELLQRMGAGFGTIGLAGVLAQAGMLSQAKAAPLAASPLAPKPPHFPPRAKRIIQLFMPGGPSHVDTFDYKPDISRYAGQRPQEVDYRTLRNTRGGLLPSPFRFRQHGQSGKWVSEIFPRVAECVDDICFIHSMHTNIPEHAGAILMMNIGHLQPSRPSMGSWLVYGLGTENQNLPGFVALCPSGGPRGGLANWGNSFLPGAYAGTHVSLNQLRPDTVLRDLRNQVLPRQEQRRQLDLLARLNRAHLQRTERDQALEASIETMELAFRMQFAVPEAFDLNQETRQTHQLYGTTPFSRGCLLARRLVERGVRVVQLTHSNDIPWDSGHGNILAHRDLARQCDQGIAALLRDLKQRGMLEDTLVLWGGEFGRAPTSEGRRGRDHDHYGFTVWMAGGGVKAGYSYGATDRFGCRAVKNRVHVHDLHATILHLMGLDHERLTFRYSGRDFRLTDVHGRVIHDIIA